MVWKLLAAATEPPGTPLDGENQTCGLREKETASVAPLRGRAAGGPGSLESWLVYGWPPGQRVTSPAGSPLAAWVSGGQRFVSPSGARRTLPRPSPPPDQHMGGTHPRLPCPTPKNDGHLYHMSYEPSGGGIIKRPAATGQPPSATTRHTSAHHQGRSTSRPTPTRLHARDMRLGEHTLS